MKTIQQHYPNVPLSELLCWGTFNGAQFLGLEQQLGSFEKGKMPGVVLIEHADIQTLKLTNLSTSRLLIPAGK
jgi:imidazolonepropionase-like amidohydrolase